MTKPNMHNGSILALAERITKLEKQVKAAEYLVETARTKVRYGVDDDLRKALVIWNKATGEAGE